MKINEIHTATKEAKMRAHVCESKGLNNVRYSALFGGAPDIKCKSYDPTGPMKSFFKK